MCVFVFIIIKHFKNVTFDFLLDLSARIYGLYVCILNFVLVKLEIQIPLAIHVRIFLTHTSTNACIREYVCVCVFVSK